MKTEKITSITTLVMGVVFLFLTFGIKQPVSTIGIGPRAWPQGLALIIIVLSVLNLYLFYKNKVIEVPKNKEDELSEEFESVIAYPKNLWISFGMLCLYVLVMPYIGFIFSTLIFTGVNIYIMGFKKLGFMTLITFIIVSLLVIIFPKFLGVPLPRGIGIFNTISRIFH